jgi:hypothetical protein
MRADVRRWHLAIAIVALVAAGRVQGQGIADLPAGARVRITLPDSARQDPFMPRAQSVIGTFARTTSDTLWLRIAGPDTVRVPRGALRRVEVSRGVSRARSAAEYGLVGLGMGVMLHAVADDDDSRRDAIGVGAITAVLGAFVGAVRPFERWRRVR